MCLGTLMVVPAVLRPAQPRGSGSLRTAEKFMIPLRSREGRGEAQRLAPGLPGLCLELQQERGDVCRNVCTGRGHLGMGCLEVEW